MQRVFQSGSALGDHVGTSLPHRQRLHQPESIALNKTDSSVAREIAQAACAFETQRTGVTPTSVTVVLSETTLVITLQGALSKAERALAMSPEGAIQVQDFHRQLFANASASLRREIKRITGVDVREAAAEVEPFSGAVIGAFTTGTSVQVYLLADNVPPDSWSGSATIAGRSGE